jgi:hypothetical protein
MRLSDGFDAVDVFGEMLYVQFHHVKDGDTDCFLPLSLEADGLFERARDVLQQVHDVGAADGVQAVNARVSSKSRADRMLSEF